MLTPWTDGRDKRLLQRRLSGGGITGHTGVVFVNITISITTNNRSGHTGEETKCWKLVVNTVNILMLNNSVNSPFFLFQNTFGCTHNLSFLNHALYHWRIEVLRLQTFFLALVFPADSKQACCIFICFFLQMNVVATTFVVRFIKWVEMNVSVPENMLWPFAIICPGEKH